MITPEALVVLHTGQGPVTILDYLWRVLLHVVGVSVIALFAYGCSASIEGYRIGSRGDGHINVQEL